MPMTLADAGYFAGKHVAELHHRGQQVVMPDKARPTDHPYHKDQFIYDEETDSYTCPRQTLAFTGIKSARKKSRIYRVASGAICRGCPAFGTCTKNGRYGRSSATRSWMYVRQLPLVERSSYAQQFKCYDQQLNLSGGWASLFSGTQVQLMESTRPMASSINAVSVAPRQFAANL